MKGGAPKGNRNAAKTRIWAEAINKILCQSDEGKKRKLELLAEKLIDTALDGDMAAIREIGDRVDGKPLAQIEVTTMQPSDMTDLELLTRLRELENAESEQSADDRIH